MNSLQSFSLQPFRSVEGAQRDYEISGYIARRSGLLSIRYALSGSIAEILVPPPDDAPARRDELWRGTCFEIFLSLAEDSRYWEFNLSPAGHWNVYRFDSYRGGMTEEMAYASLPFAVENRPGFLSLVLEASLDGVARPHEMLDVGISAVITHRNIEPTFWALTHCGPKADFHRRESFIIRL